ncbi:acyl-CoA dehydrogenase family protein [Pseudodesulfovibrio piezophilus]|uniref:Acyl-CoA dehydrogenase domain protein n=1 Tax=Pseudodesulfovibrio piezophilus (strain DSM 21447 / JCM 15486 / C1TLV30) TaxID=1322246 RepID=M1WNI2_PSEP2|nr:acyl-CoA dehydrogenase family protein [Pseudodesulfovibrio piezophilus]CCH50365.1 Acyl-CoA dehydrogenase domain protein [Pseudodesulfovibrio piezophilus C1TLV30]
MYTLRTLPGDDVRQIMWRFADRFDLQMSVQSARSIARSVVAKLVAEGARNTHEWTEQKDELLTAFDQSGLTALFMDPHQGGFIEGPKNLALALVAFELSWVDAGAATSSLASNLALAPIHEKGTSEQRDYYMSKCVPPQPGEEREIWRGAFALTEPLPYIGVDTGVLCGKATVADWNEGEEPMLQIDKRGRFITNMDFANFVTAAVESNDERIKGTFMIILEEGDEGIFDRGAPTLKMVHQLSSTRDPVLNLKVPASRIIGGYEVVDGVIVPKYNHSEIIGAVFHRTRIPVGLMTSAKLLSAVEPVIRYHRNRFRGGDAAKEGSPRYDKGLQNNEDALQRLVDIWASGEAGCSLAFAASRLADAFDPIEKAKEVHFEAEGVTSARKQMVALRKLKDQVFEFIDLEYAPEAERDQARYVALKKEPLVSYAYMEALAGILNPGVKLWNTGVGANMMREAVALVGGYGITEDCPGFLMQKWTDTQLEATYEGPEAVQRRHMTMTMTSEVFQHILSAWIRQMKAAGATVPGLGGYVLASAMELWQWTFKHLQTAKDDDGRKLFHSKRQGVTFALADALGWLLGPYFLATDVMELIEKGPMAPTLAEGLDDLTGFYKDLCHIQSARAAGEVARICTELVYGFNTCLCPKSDGTIAEKCEPETKSPSECSPDGQLGDQSKCSRDDLKAFRRLKATVDMCMAGSRSAKDRAGNALGEVMIPEALDYPLG